MKKSVSTKNQVMDCLQWPSEEYDQRLFETIWNWCHIYGKYPSIIQQLLANSQVNKWFLTEYEKCEIQFLKVADVVPNRVEPLRAHYKACTAQIMAIYPQALIDDIKRNRNFTTIIIDNTIYYAN